MTHRTQATVSTGSADPITASTKFKIEQPVPDNSVKKGPYAVERTVDPNDVVIKRRFGEGSRPIFERDDISINRSLTTNSADFDSTSKTVSRRISRHSSSNSSSPEYYRKRERDYPPRSSRPLINRNLTKLENLTPLKRKPSVKLPYFADEKREKERLVGRYGSTKSCESSKRSQHTNEKRTLSRRSKRSYSRSLSPSPMKDHRPHRPPMKDYSTSHRSPIKDYSTSHRSSTSQRHRSSRSKSGERYRHSSRKHYRAYPEIESRSRTSIRSRSRTRSHSRERKLMRSAEHNVTANAPIAAPATQIITIPVPIDPYRFPGGYSSWPHIQSWPSAAHSATRFATPYALPPTIPSFVDPAIYSAAYRPPPPSYGGPYSTRPFRPRFNPRPMRGNYIPRNY